jgi:hypothetical protein
MVRSLGPDRRRPSRSVLLAVSTMPRKPRSASARPRAEHLTAKRMGGPTKLTQPLHMIASPVGGSAGAPTPAMQIQTPCSTASKTTATIAARSYFGRRLPRSLLTPPLQQEGFLPHQLLHRPRRRISHHQHTNPSPTYGPTPTYPPTPAYVSVPNLLGLSLSGVRQALPQGLMLRTVTGSGGTVVDQQPKAGDVVAPIPTSTWCWAPRAFRRGLPSFSSCWPCSAS